ncbi:diguanylate cyclase domain-containing protein [Vibrio nigripulchritudo]|uniref:diguanylate cyclase domain-containing protein n=1 Tax=Vibrio nigripulchritudo TaxID=28173 RepID=UPI00138E11B2|nr:diguanylate cyclase [Vibrio nigripulchritudo]
MLTIVIAVSMHEIHKQHKNTETVHKDLIDLHLLADTLRSRLWLYLKYEDDDNLRGIQQYQLALDQTLSNSSLNQTNIEKLRVINRQLSQVLIMDWQFRNQTESRRQASIEQLGQRQELLRARYSALIQSMTEYLVYSQQTLISNGSKKIDAITLYLTFALAGGSIVVSVLSFLLVFRFRRGMDVVSGAIHQIREGKFEHTIQNEDLDAEFQSLAAVFNDMSEELRNSTYSRAELKSEILSKTRLLRQQKRKLEQLAEHDELTSLMNRRALDKKLDQALNIAAKAPATLAVLFIDLNNFKEINDKYGHKMGDEVLINISARLRCCVRESDVLARFGGDEFVLCLDVGKTEDLARRKANQLISLIEKPIRMTDVELTVGASIGIAYSPSQGRCRQELLKLADRAMYKAKELPHSGFVEYDSGLNV